MAAVVLVDQVADSTPVAAVLLAEQHADYGGGSLASVAISGQSATFAGPSSPASFAASSGTGQWLPQTVHTSNGTGSWSSGGTVAYSVVQAGSSAGGTNTVAFQPTSGSGVHALIAVVLSNSATSDVVTASDGTVLTPLVYTAGHGGDYTGIFIYPEVPDGVTSMSCPGCYCIGYLEVSGPADAFADLGVVTGGSATAVTAISLPSPAGQDTGTLTVFCVGYPGTNSGAPHATGLSDYELSNFGQFAWTAGSGSLSATQGAHTWDGCAVTFGPAGGQVSVDTGVFRGRLGQYSSSGNTGALTAFAGMPPAAGNPLSSIQAYEAFLGRTVDYVLDYLIEAPTSWTAFEQAWVGTDAGTAVPLAGWGDIGSRKFMLGVSPCAGASIGSGGASWLDEANGVNDTHWAALGDYLIAHGYADACLRIGREWNGSWYPWNVKPSDVTNFIAGWQHIVTLLRARSGAQFTFMWNPFLGQGGNGITDVTAAYPGSSYVDFIGLDVYDGGYTTLSSPPYTRDIATQEARFATQESQANGLAAWKTFAAAQGVPLAFPEWGLELWWSNGYPGGGDNAYFISQMATKYISGAGMHALWEHPGNGVYDPDTSSFRKLNGTILPVPQSRRAFLRAFAGS